MILSAGAIGFTYIVWNGQNTADSDLDDLPRIIIVGIWDALDDNQDYAPHEYHNDWLVEFGDNNFSNTDYLSVSNTNTRITLLKPGWYRIHLSASVGGIDPSNEYRIIILKDGAIELYLDRYQSYLAGSVDFHNIDSSAFVYSNGANYIEINGYSLTDDFQFASDLLNQFTIEYVAI